jgi:hypothetical protein
MDLWSKEAIVPATSSGPSLVLQQSISVPGIFDLKWSPACASSLESTNLSMGGLLAAALSDGSICMYNVVYQHLEDQGSQVC